jgi:mRNA interferase MazF
MGRVKRGEIWLVAGGVYASKPRPALIVQDDRFDTDSVTGPSCACRFPPTPRLASTTPAS